MNKAGESESNRAKVVFDTPGGPERAVWQDIATAPKGLLPSGVIHIIILGFAADEEGYAPDSRAGFWNTALHRWSSVLDPAWTSSPQPTHWMPLPPPPEGSK